MRLEIPTMSEAQIKIETVTVDVLMKALDEAVKLQAHYAALLNMHDGGERIPFASAEAFLVRMLARNAPTEFARSVLEAAGEQYAPAIPFTKPELSAILAACGFAYEHGDGPEGLDAMLDQIGEKIADAAPELSQGCGNCPACKAEAANRCNDPSLN